MVEDARTGHGHKFVALRTRLLRMHEQQSIDGVPNKILMVEDARIALGNQFVKLRTRWWRMHEWQSIHGAPNKI